MSKIDMDFNSSLWVDNSPKTDLKSKVYIRHYDNPHNTMQGIFRLYTGRNRDIESTIFIYQSRGHDMKSVIRVRKDRREELRSFATIKYRRNTELNGSIEAVAGNFLDAFIEIKPNNVMYGQYDLLEAPRITKDLPPIKDAFTRSEIDYQSINWGTEKRMLVGRDKSKLDQPEYTSFLEFDLSGGLGKDKLIENATLRLYYQNPNINGVDLEFATNNKYWSELGITYLNKPMPNYIITNKFSENKTERYIDVDLTEIVKKWYDGTVTNFGLNINSLFDTPVTFYTKENGLKTPKLSVKYIDTSKSYSANIAPLDATMFVIGHGHSEREGKITVHSDRGADEKEATLYVHRIGVPLPNDKESTIGTSRPMIDSKLIISRFENNETESFITVYQQKVDDKHSKIANTIPELFSQINVDPDAHLKASITTKAFVENDPNANKDSFLIFHKPEISVVIEVPSYAWLDATVTVKSGYVDEREATIAVPTYVGDKSPWGRTDGDKKAKIESTTPELASTVLIYHADKSELGGFIKVYERTEIKSDIAVSRPEIDSTISTKIKSEINAMINIRGASWIDATLVAKQINELPAFLMIHNADEKKSTIASSRPEIHGFIFRRYAEDKDLNARATFRAKDVADLTCRFGAKGKSAGAYYFII
ncbi:hypothetical protein SUNDANCE_53 [Brevibacillus phage Sundance]|uniref:hypothetical protein n=1 Tax=Brevibacillus phage Sundance TaxID=1691958 RepID=UPI0006BC52C2|nr:hypothetical protein AVT09_gp053 [Brevibacillus phage Sundance]ALA47869.1 hypothetical protein SUNDANCE_53 [Brevibacillus phage Sundance]